SAGVAGRPRSTAAAWASMSIPPPSSASPAGRRSSLADSPYTIEEFTASDGYRWCYRRYRMRIAECVLRNDGAAQAIPNPPPRAHVVALHGIQSHAGWYEYSCTRLAQAGFIVSFLDRRGSGMNQQARGDTPSFGRLLDDVAEFTAQLRAQSAIRNPQ